MSLSDFFTTDMWAIKPDALDSLSSLIQSHLQEATSKGLENTEALSVSDSSSKSDDAYYIKDGVAIIDISGSILRKGGRFWFFSWAGHDVIRAGISKAMQDQQVHSVLLSFDSPGGVAVGVKELADFISSQTSKPIYSYVDGLCASAAYWIASATRRIYAPQVANVGSIGVVRVHCDYSVSNTNRGLRYTYITAGKQKALGNPDAPLSFDDQILLQSTVEQLHDVFRSDVATYMRLDLESVASWGDGQVFLTAKALDVGLITGVVNDRDALVTLINKEVIVNMDRAQLEQQHPDLLAQIEAVAHANGIAEALQDNTDTHVEMKKNHTEAICAVVAAVAGQDVADKVQSIVATGVDAEQLKAVVAVLGSDGKQAEKQEDTASDKTEASSRAEILATLKEKTPEPVNTLAKSKDVDPIQAVIEQISSVDS